MYQYATSNHETFGNILGIGDTTRDALLDNGAMIHLYEEPSGYEYVEVPNKTNVVVIEDTYYIYLGNCTFIYHNEGEYPGFIQLYQPENENELESVNPHTNPDLYY